MKKQILKRFSAMILLFIVLILASEAFSAEVPEHIQDAHRSCLMAKLADQGVDFNNSNGFLRGAIAIECEKIIGWEE